MPFAPSRVLASKRSHGTREIQENGTLCYVPSSVPVTTSKALVTSSVALVPSSFLFTSVSLMR